MHAPNSCWLLCVCLCVRAKCVMLLAASLKQTRHDLTRRSRTCVVRLGGEPHHRTVTAAAAVCTDSYYSDSVRVVRSERPLASLCVSVRPHTPLRVCRSIGGPFVRSSVRPSIARVAFAKLTLRRRCPVRASLLSISHYAARGQHAAVRPDYRQLNLRTHVADARNPINILRRTHLRIYTCLHCLHRMCRAGPLCTLLVSEELPESRECVCVCVLCRCDVTAPGRRADSLVNAVGVGSCAGC